MKRTKIGLLSAIFLGISAIMGSGWLFAPFKSATVAGPAAIISWIIGAVLILLLSLSFAEIASVYPRRGLSAIIATMSHNKFFGFPFAISNWLGVVAVIGLEADATVQYLINLMPQLKSSLFAAGQLTLMGNSFSVMLVVFYCLVNFWGAGLLAKTNNILTIIKLVVPVITALIIISFAFHPSNFTSFDHTFVPFGLKSVLVALVTSGIVVAFNGFQTVVTFASEIENPSKTIPLALLMAIIVSLIIYLLLQVAFVGALPVSYVARGWNHLSLNAPMVQLSLMLGLNVLASIVYFGASVAPTGAAIAFTGSATRMFTAMSRRQQMPKYFDQVHPVYRVSRRSLLMNVFLSITFVLLFRSWSKLAEVLSLFHLISYLPISLALVVFRNRVKKSRYSFRLSFGKVISFALFFTFTCLLVVANKAILAELVVFLGVLLLGFILLNVRTRQGFLSAIMNCYTVVLYFAGLVAFTQFSAVSDLENVHLWVDFLFTGFVSLSFYLMTRNNSSQKILNSKK